MRQRGDAGSVLQHHAREARGARRHLRFAPASCSCWRRRRECGGARGADSAAGGRSARGGEAAPRDSATCARPTSPPDTDRILSRGVIRQRRGDGGGRADGPVCGSARDARVRARQDRRRRRHADIPWGSFRLRPGGAADPGGAGGQDDGAGAGGGGAGGGARHAARAATPVLRAARRRARRTTETRRAAHAAAHREGAARGGGARGERGGGGGARAGRRRHARAGVRRRAAARRARGAARPRVPRRTDRERCRRGVHAVAGTRGVARDRVHHHQSRRDHRDSPRGGGGSRRAVPRRRRARRPRVAAARVRHAALARRPGGARLGRITAGGGSVDSKYFICTIDNVVHVMTVVEGFPRAGRSVGRTVLGPLCSVFTSCILRCLLYLHEMLSLLYMNQYKNDT